MRNPQIVAVARHYGLSIATCVPADPQSKGGSEATVRIAKADIVPTEHNLRESYGSFAELELACESFCDRVNTREHRVTRRAPAVALAEERLHPLARVPNTLYNHIGPHRALHRRTPLQAYSGRVQAKPAGASAAITSAFAGTRSTRRARSACATTAVSTKSGSAGPTRTVRSSSWSPIRTSA